MPESRRDYLSIQAALLLGAAAPSGRAAEAHSREPGGVPSYARAQDYTCLRQSSYDRTGGNRDSFEIAPGATQEVFSATGPGIITHVWFTIAAETQWHLKELVLRVFWEGNDR